MNPIGHMYLFLPLLFFFLVKQEQKTDIKYNFINYKTNNLAIITHVKK